MPEDKKDKKEKEANPRRQVKEKADKDIESLADAIESSMLSDEGVSSKVTLWANTGSTMLNLALGNPGWAYGRIINIVGDESTGKSLLAGEAIAFAQHTQDAITIYDDPESTFESFRSESYGVNPKKVIYRQSDTVEDFFETVITLLKDEDYGNRPIIYILDSLDALSTVAEIEKPMDKASYGTAKALKMSEGMRKISRAITKVNFTLIIISQTRDKIGVTFGEKTDISGGKALKFYSSQRIKLAVKKKLYTGTVDNKKFYGVQVRAKVIKNKLAAPFHEIEFPILFASGIDDLTSCVEYLSSIKYYKGASYSLPSEESKKFKSKDAFIKHIEENDKEEELRDIVKFVWEERQKVESNRKPKW